MKKKYGLESIIGKKSKLRFPRLVYNLKVELLTFVLPANSAMSLPPLSTAITMAKGDPYDFCDQFNEESYEYEEGFPLNVVIYISTVTLLFEIQSPTIFSLFNIIFDLEEVETERFRANKVEILLSIFNFALIKLNPEEDFFKRDLIAKVRSIYGNLISYNCRQRTPKRSKGLLPHMHKRRYLINKKNLPYNRKLHLKRIKHSFVLVTKRRGFREFKHLLRRIHGYYDLLDDWDDIDDFFWKDIVLSELKDLYQYHLFANTYQTLFHNLYKIDNVFILFYTIQIVHKTLRNLLNVSLDINQDHLLPFLSSEKQNFAFFDKTFFFDPNNDLTFNFNIDYIAEEDDEDYSDQNLENNA